MKKTIAIMTTIALAIAAFLLLRARGGDAGEPAADAPAVASTRSAPARTQAIAPPDLAFLTDDDRAGSLRLEGQVIEEDGTPVGGAVVRIATNPPRETATEQDGSFFFEALMGRDYTLVARTDIGVAGPVSARLTELNDPVILIVRPAASVQVTVRDAAGGRPVATAAVELRGLLRQAATADSQGIAQFEHVPAGRYQVVAVADGYARATTWLDVGGADASERVELALRSGAAVAGRVVDASGAPVEGAVVLYVGASDRTQQAHPRYDGVPTDARGEFRIAAMPAGTFRFEALHSTFAPAQSDPITLDGKSERTGVIIQMQSGATIAGKVVDEHGAPVAAAAVRVAAAGPGARFGRPRQTFADDTGRFAMDGLPRQPMDVVAVHQTASSETRRIDLSGAPAATGLVLALDVTGRIAGTVSDSDGEPLEGAQVLLWPDSVRGPGSVGDFRLRSQSTALTDAGGRFEFRGLVGGRYTLRANRPGVSARERAFVREDVYARVGDVDVQLVLDDDGVVTGRVAFEDGSPPAAFNVSLGGFAGVGGTGTPFASADGSFELRDVPAGRYTIAIRGAGFSRAEVPEVEIAPGETRDVGTITVRRGRTIAGRVVTAEHQPVEGATVVLGKTLFGTGTRAAAVAFTPSGTKTGTTDENGEFAISGVPSHDLNVIADHETAGRTMPVVIPGSRESVYGLQLVIEPTGALDGTVTMAGEPAADVPVSCQSQSVPNAIFHVASGHDGRFRFDRLSPGKYMVSALTGGNPMRGMSFHDGKVLTIASNETATVELEIAGGSIELEVTPVPKSGTLEFAQVYSLQGEVTATTARELMMQTANGAGGFSSFGASIAGNPAVIRDLSAGDYTVCAVPYPSEVDSMPEMLDYMERAGDDLPIYCRRTAVAEQPDRQQLTIDVEIPAFVPAGGGEG
jgi:protocatechuate 3,4-dioxygenase beta subunit